MSQITKATSNKTAAVAKEAHTIWSRFCTANCRASVIQQLPISHIWSGFELQASGVGGETVTQVVHTTEPPKYFLNKKIAYCT